MIRIWKWFVWVLFIPVLVAAFAYGILIGMSCAINGQTKEDAFRRINKIGIPLQDLHDEIACCFD